MSTARIDELNATGWEVREIYSASDFAAIKELDVILIDNKLFLRRNYHGGHFVRHIQLGNGMGCRVTKIKTFKVDGSGGILASSYTFSEYDSNDKLQRRSTL